MWYLKTKLGVFWVVPTDDRKSQYLLGINDEELAFYTDTEEAAQAVFSQSTGFLRWDSESCVKAPEHIEEWVEGEPKDWKSVN